MKSWKTNLIGSNADLGAVKINRGIFQGGSLSPLPLTLILRKMKQQVKYLTLYILFEAVWW